MHCATDSVACLEYPILVYRGPLEMWMWIREVGLSEKVVVQEALVLVRKAMSPKSQMAS